jgi:hypothetical protein
MNLFFVHFFDISSGYNTNQGGAFYENEVAGLAPDGFISDDGSLSGSGSG